MIKGTLPLVALVLWLLAAPVALANMAPPWQEGDPVGEPAGAVKNVAISHEDLLLDLRPLDSGSPVPIVATYKVRNAGSGEHLQLVFVAEALSRQGASVQLDGKAVATQRGTLAELPSSWKAPAETPGIGGGTYEYRTRGSDALEFSLDLPPGDHTIRVHYLSLPSAYSGDSPVRYWQIGYVLAPARQWASFGDLSVTVQLPADNWRAASNVSLTRSGSTLTGHFSGVPADSLAITVQAPEPHVLNWVPVGWLGGALLIVLLGLLVGMLLGRLRWTSLLGLPVAIVLGVGWMIAIIIAYGAAEAKNYVPDSQVAWDYHYRAGLAYIALAFLAIIPGIILAQLAVVAGHFLGRRR